MPTQACPIIFWSHGCWSITWHMNHIQINFDHLRRTRFGLWPPKINKFIVSNIICSSKYRNKFYHSIKLGSSQKKFRLISTTNNPNKYSAQISFILQVYFDQWNKFYQSEPVRLNFIHIHVQNKKSLPIYVSYAILPLYIFRLKPIHFFFKFSRLSKWILPVKPNPS